MEKPTWNEERYIELNTYFRVRIQQLLETDPHLQKQVADGASLQLAEIIECMTLNDQVAWQEFLELDQIKMHRDLQNHLEGKGAPLDSKTGFYRTPQNGTDEEPPLW
ncbi:hypothetical protein TH63_08155 [Rufibacter radiotolerans]|uniref:Uncharacterized protein n=1 Tax=Rufibacter radiotolerans TaxID=1379910 RepID=A0A0H4VPI9_9BACT|nr:hypothetical protein [Rufibacter radiotolerans]AKQ45629.1 hypothetical protein TH63_08155 [Rufibacter radiotolerans]